MLPNIGHRTDEPPELRHVRDLEAYEGPILSEYRADESGAFYVEKWCTRQGDVSRSLLVRSDQRAIAEFLGGRLSMLKLLANRGDRVGSLIDRKGRDIVATWLVSISELPRGYLPKPDRFHDETFRPDWDLVPQSYLVDVDDWDAGMFAAIERNFINAAAFAFHTKPGTNRELPSNVLAYKYNGGYSVATALRAIQEHVPVEDRAKPSELAAASPGVLTISTPSETSARLAYAIRALPGSALYYRAVHNWSRLNMDNAEAVPPVARENVEHLCRALNVDARKLYTHDILVPKDEKYAVLVAGKLIAAYYRVLLRTVRPLHGVELMGATLDEEPDVPLVDLQEDE